MDLAVASINEQLLIVLLVIAPVFEKDANKYVGEPPLPFCHVQLSSVIFEKLPAPDSPI